jgi:hypothetical protein
MSGWIPFRSGSGCFVLDQSRFFIVDVDDLADDDLNVAAVLASMRLERFAPTAIQQNSCRRDAGRRGAGLLADNPGERPDA